MLYIESNTSVVDVMIEGWHFQFPMCSSKVQVSTEEQLTALLLLCKLCLSHHWVPVILVQTWQAPWGLHLGFKAGPIRRALGDHMSCPQGPTSAQESKEGDWGQWHLSALLPLDSLPGGSDGCPGTEALRAFSAQACHSYKLSEVAMNLWRGQFFFLTHKN